MAKKRTTRKKPKAATKGRKEPQAATKGLSLHIGLNSVDPDHYEGWDGRLQACEFDAKDYKAIATRQGFRTKILLTRGATHKAVTDEIRRAAATLKTGNIFLLTYSGHGGRVPDRNGDELEDGTDETWVLYDREIVDDELYALWGLFQRGVRILILSDSCHSGTVARVPLYTALTENETFARQFDDPEHARFRVMPDDVAERTYKRHKELYDRDQRTYPSGEKASVGASVILISGCQDNQFSYDGPRNGAFTKALKEVWNNGRFRGNHRKFHLEIQRKMPPWQAPNFFQAGLSSPQFEGQRPFTI